MSRGIDVDSPMFTESIGQEFSVQAYSTRRSDIWALGVVLVNMITGLCPWEKATSDDDRFCEYLLDDSYLARNLPVSRGVVRILNKVFRINPRSRPSLEQLRESILAVDTFFPPKAAPARPSSPHPTDTDATLAPGLATVEAEETEAAEHAIDSSPSSPCSEEDLSSICLSTAGTSDGETMSTDDSAPATPPDYCPTPLEQTELVEEVDKALRSLVDAPEPVMRVAELSILERLDIQPAE